MSEKVLQKEQRVNRIGHKCTQHLGFIGAAALYYFSIHKDTIFQYIRANVQCTLYSVYSGHSCCRRQAEVYPRWSRCQAFWPAPLLLLEIKTSVSDPDSESGSESRGLKKGQKC